MSSSISVSKNFFTIELDLTNRVGPLAFVHIPKCSGTSFEKYLLACDGFSQESECFVSMDQQGHLEDFEGYARRKSQTPFVYGHVEYSVYVDFFPDALITTFLRDPVQRTISQYKSWHDPKNWHPADPHYKTASPEVMAALEFSQRATLEEFVSTDNAHVRAGALGNKQTLMLSSLTDASLAEHLESAKDNLRRCIFFGITERFDESICMFRSVFIGAPEYSLPHGSENRSSVQVAEIPIDVINEITRQVSYDIQLYEFAIELFEQRKILGAPRTYLFSQLTQSPPSVDEMTILLGFLNDAGKENLRLKAQVDGFDGVENENSCLKGRIDELDGVESENLYLKGRVGELDGVENENSYLKGRIDELVNLYSDIVESRAWKLIEFLRRIKEYV